MNIKYNSIIFPTLLVLILTVTMCAQPSKEQLKEKKDNATATFLDATKTKAQRLRSVKELGYPEDNTFGQLIKIGIDKSEDSDIRLVALKTHRYDDEYFNAVMTILSDDSESKSLVEGLIYDIGQRTTFRITAANRQRLQANLRKRLDDPNEGVRLAAYRVLVSSHDIVAIDKLVESLRSGNNIPIPIADGIELLDVDGANKHLVTLRPYLNHPDPNVQAQAARALAEDSQSRDAVVEIASNKEKNTDTREKALRGLSREDKNFMAYAIKLMLDVEESADIRYEAMENAMRRLNYQNETASAQIEFAQAVERISAGRRATTSDGKELTAEAKVLLPYLKKSFPAIGRFYRLKK